MPSAVVGVFLTGVTTPRRLAIFRWIWTCEGAVL